MNQQTDVLLQLCGFLNITCRIAENYNLPPDIR